MRILLVEPDEGLAREVLAALQREGYAPEVVTRVEDLQGDVLKAEYHLCILDEASMCQGRLGPCRTLQASSTSPVLLILTAHPEVAHRVACLRCGADDILVRPFALEELVARVVALHRRLTHRLTYGELTLDLVKRQAEFDGAPIALTNRELELLAYFMQHPDEVLSREVLATEVWNTLFDPGTNVVDVYVTYLRRKLGACGSTFIHTVRGRGYRFGRARDAAQA